MYYRRTRDRSGTLFNCHEYGACMLGPIAEPDQVKDKITNIREL